MINRDRYLGMRRKNQYDPQWFYSYYVDNVHGYKAPVNVFYQAFSAYFQMSMYDILNHLDKAMDVTKIEDAHGTLIYIN